MIQIFKIFHRIDIMGMANNFSFQQSQTRGKCFKYHSETSRHNHRANFIFNRSFLSNLWNFLPNQFVNAETFNGFKAGLDYWMSNNQANQLSRCAKNTLILLNLINLKSINYFKIENRSNFISNIIKHINIWIQLHQCSNYFQIKL